MIRLKNILLPTLIVCVFSCKNEKSNFYAITDFKKSLQPFLSEIATTGIVTYHDSSQMKSITDKELIQLSKFENPLLRATALGEMLERSSFNHFDVVINHLDDTAIVAVDHGEFGIAFRRVSDYLIGEARWKTRQEKNNTIDKVLTKHNYLRSAYTILSRLEPQEKYYPYIRDMATRPRYLSRHEGYELGFDEIEYALYGLAKFKKKADVQIIKNKFMKHVWMLSDVSFRLMEEFPDTAYLDVLQTYHHMQFYEFSGNRPHGFTGFNADRAAPEDFIRALVIQQNERSAKLLDTMLTSLPRFTCMPDKESIINEVIAKIWEHPCPAYAQLREKTRPEAEKILAARTGNDLGPVYIPSDTTTKIFYWYN